MNIKDMLGRSGVVSREAATRALSEQLITPSLPPEEIAISGAVGRILAIDVPSPSDLPGFDRSTMDGYAVRSSDTFGAAESRPVFLNVVGDIPMGTVPDRKITAGQAMKIATGGALPNGADSVVMLEHTQPVDGQSIEVVKDVGPLENVVQAGDDIKKGEIVLERGHRIRPQDMAALAAIGITRVKVFDKLKVAIISTGNEIIPAQDLPGPGQIRDSNSYNLEGAILLAAGIPIRMGIIPDDYSRLRSALEAAVKESGLVLMTGGSSVGTADLTAKVIDDVGQPGVLVHGVAIKPGKPLILGLVKRDKDWTVPVFGLPGHPAAVAICFDLFVKPVLVRLAGELPDPVLEEAAPYKIVRGRLARSISSAPGREDHIRVTVEKKDNGLWVRPVFGASGLISTLVKAVGTVVVPVDKIGIEAGEEVEVRLFS